MSDFSKEELSWFHENFDREPGAYFDKFGIEDKHRGHRRYSRLIQAVTLCEELRMKLVSDFEVWKVDKAAQYWLNRRARLSAINTATKLVEGSEPFAEEAISYNAVQARSNFSTSSDSIGTSLEQKAQSLSVVTGN